MKKLIAGLALVALVTIGACKKDHHENPPVTSIIGTWELSKVEGGLNGGGNYDPGNGNTVTFTDSSTFQYALHDQVKSSGTYTIKGVKWTKYSCAIDSGNTANAIVFGFPSYSQTTVYELKGTKLVLYVGCIAADGVIAEYNKIDAID